MDLAAVGSLLSGFSFAVFWGRLQVLSLVFEIWIRSDCEAWGLARECAGGEAIAALPAVYEGRI
jgi:hypothetical protein